MSGLQRWTGSLDLGPFRFQATGGEPLPLTLRDRGGRMLSEDGRDFCSTSDLRAVVPLAWRGLPALVVRPEDGPGLLVVWMDARGIDTPETFRARMLGA